MELTPEQQNKVDRLLEAEKRGILGNRPDLEERLSEMRKRGIVPPSAFDLAETSPLPVNENELLKRSVQPRGPNFTADPVDHEKLATLRARAEAGIEEDNLGFQDNFKLGLSLNPSKELKGVLDKRFGADIPVRYDRNTGKYQYVNPTTKRITNVGIEGADVGDVGKAAGDAPVVAGDIGGTVIGGAVGASLGGAPGAVAGETTGSAAGTYIGEVARLYLGKINGVNEDLTFEDINNAALKKAGFAAGATGAVGALSHTGKAVSNFIMGRSFTREAALRSGLQSQEADEAIAVVNGLLENSGRSQRVLSTTAKRTNDPIALGDEAVIRREKDFVREFVERDRNDQEALIAAYDAISPVSSKGSRDVVNKFGTDKNRRLAKANDALEASARNMEEQLNAITPVESVDSGRLVRGAIEEQRTVVNNKVNAVNNQWKRLAGFNKESGTSQIQIPVGDNTESLLKALDQESRDAIFRVTSRDRQGLFSFADEDPSPLKDFVLPASVREELSIDRIGKKPVDLIDYQRAISDIRTTIRAADKGESVSKGQQTVLKRALNALIKDRDTYLRQTGRDDVFFAVKNADVYTRQARDMLDRSILGDLMRKQGNRYKVRSQDVFDTTFVKGGDEQAAELYAGISGNKEAMRAWRTEILNKYRREVFADGKTTAASRKAHDKFMDDYRGAMRPFFSRDELARIDKVGGLVSVVEKQEQQYQRILKALNGTTPPKGSGGRNVVARTRNKLSSLEPEAVVPWLVTSKTEGPARARRLVSLLASDQPALEGIRADTRKAFRDSVMPDGKTIDGRKFDSELRKNAQTYRELFGEQYVNDLFAINDVLRISSRAGRSLGEKEAIGIETSIARATVAPPLTREGRALTAFMRFRGKTARQAIARALLNPEDLNEIARLSVLSRSSREASELAGSLGLLEYIDEDLE